jgi:uncharacterized circularly permuted ATP-grasp superfamily protein
LTKFATLLIQRPGLPKIFTRRLWPRALTSSFWVMSLIFQVQFAIAQGIILPARPGHYDEVFREIEMADGRRVKMVRPEYKDVVDVAGKLTPVEVKIGEILTWNEFQADNVLSLIPRIILDTDFKERLEPGIDQRGRALRAFLQDFHATGGRPAISVAGIIPQEVLDRIVMRSGESWMAGRVNPQSISLFYGPDIIRDQNDVFRVVEDNTGYLGGAGDLKLALEALYRNVPYRRLHSYEPMDFYKKLASRFRERANPRGGKVVMLMTPPYPDNEAHRVMRLMKEVGIQVVTPYTKSQLEIDSNGEAWLIHPDQKRRQRVGFIALEGEHWWMDAHHPEQRKTATIEWSHLAWESIQEIYNEARARAELRVVKGDSNYGSPKEKTQAIYRQFLMAIRKVYKFPADLPLSEVDARLRRFHAALTAIDPVTGQPQADAIEARFKEMNLNDHFSQLIRYSHRGLFDALASGKVPTNYSPGTNFTNDKEFYTYMEKVISFYLGEQPLLRNIETHDPRLFRRGIAVGLNESLIDQVQKNQKDWVIKVVDGRGGKGIWVGAKISKAEFAKGVAAVRTNPDKYLLQRYTPLSELSGMIVDLRIHSDIAPKGGVFVSRTPWGRGLPQNGDGKVNLSASGKEVAVIVRRAQPFCESMFVPTQ